MIYWTAFTLGVFGSLHCVGMCGPLMMALPTPEKSHTRLVRLLLYQVGRISSYAILGFLLGWLGWGARLWNAQGYLAIFSGVLLILFAIFRIDAGNYLQRLPIFGRFQLLLRRKFADLFQQGGTLAYIGTGFLNGWLPCGLVYVAVVGAANAGHPLYGALFMAIFGLGTTPLLLTTVWLGKGVIRKYLPSLPRWAPLLVAAVGILLIWRAGQVQLPDSFNFFQAMESAPMCH